MRGDEEAREDGVADGRGAARERAEADPVVEVKTDLEEEPNEGNEFSGALAQAKKDGKKEFEVDGKKYKVESEETDEEAVTEETDDELEEGKLPPGLQAYQDKKKKKSGDKEAVEESEEHTYTVVHAKHGKEEIKASSSYGAAKKYADMKKLKGTAGVDAHLHTKEQSQKESINALKMLSGIL